MPDVHWPADHQRYPKADTELADLRAEVARLTAEQDEARTQLNGYQEREAALCPEDVGLDEWCATMKKRTDAAESTLAQLRQQQQALEAKWRSEADLLRSRPLARAIAACADELAALSGEEPIHTSGDPT
jgi:predicted  nucleic acid-binding Zn-ribbon protein